MAPITTLGDILLKSGLKRNSSPSAALGSINELMQNTISITNSSGISMLAIFSMPFCTPRISTTKLIIKNSTVHTELRTGLLTNAPNRSLYSCGVKP